LLCAASENRLRAAYVLALSTGMRGGEILALQQPDVDLAKGTLSVRRTLILNGSGVGTPKSKNSPHTIQLPNIALDALAEHKSNGSDWLFPGRTGKTLRCHNFITYQWTLRRACRY